jgi:PAT family beta-lactamase induction signal transducer AmpG
MGIGWRLPDLLSSRRGRLAAFFLLYTTEGVPLGFAATAVATQLRRMGVGPAEIGAFVAAFYLPWAFKWAAGPLVDVFRSRRFGHRRAWILGTQLLMAGTLLSLLWVPLPQALPLFTAVLLLHNAAAAVQDVAIDALAVQSLAPDERGLANGLMFAGAALGQAAGGAGVLALTAHLGFDAGFVAVALAILAVTGLVVLPMKEALAPDTPAGGAALARVRDFAGDAFRAFLGSRAAFAGLFFALLPAGAMSLSLALQSSLAVELGMDDGQVALLALLSTLTSGIGMVVGGLLSDRLGRRRMLALYLLAMSGPALVLAGVLQQAGYTMPRAPGSPPLPELIDALRVAVIVFSGAMGLMYGTRSAVFMDITDPRAAATQFTAYMAMMNVAIAFAATWQGAAIEAWGYPVTLLVDACVGPLALLLLPWMAPGRGADPAGAARRARAMAGLLAAGCAAFVPWWLLHDPRGPATGVAQTVFTLVFVASALFLGAASLLQRPTAAWRRALRWLALALLALYARRFLGADATLPLQAGVAGVAAAGALALVRVALAPWPGLSPAPAPAPAAAPGPAPAAGRESPAG